MISNNMRIENSLFLRNCLLKFHNCFLTKMCLFFCLNCHISTSAPDLEKVPDPGILDPRKISGLGDLAEKLWANSSALLTRITLFLQNWHFQITNAHVFSYNILNVIFSVFNSLINTEKIYLIIFKKISCTFVSYY